MNLRRFERFWPKNSRFLSLFSVCLLTIQETTFNEINHLRGDGLQSVQVGLATENEECPKNVRVATSCTCVDLFLWPNGPGFGFEEGHGHTGHRGPNVVTVPAAGHDWQFGQRRTTRWNSPLTG